MYTPYTINTQNNTNRVDSTTREVSLTAPPPTNAAGRQLTSKDGRVTEEDFYSCIDAQLVKGELHCIVCMVLIGLY